MSISSIALICPNYIIAWKVIEFQNLGIAGFMQPASRIQLSEMIVIFFFIKVISIFSYGYYIILYPFSGGAICLLNDTFITINIP